MKQEDINRMMFDDDLPEFEVGDYVLVPGQAVLGVIEHVSLWSDYIRVRINGMSITLRKNRVKVVHK